MDNFEFKLNSFPKGWKALQFTFAQRPKGFNQWFNGLWGWDIWYYNFPLVKTLILINILIWIIFII